MFSSNVYYANRSRTKIDRFFSQNSYSDYSLYNLLDVLKRCESTLLVLMYTLANISVMKQTDLSSRHTYISLRTYTFYALVSRQFTRKDVGFTCGELVERNFKQSYLSFTAVLLRLFSTQHLSGNSP